MTTLIILAGSILATAILAWLFRRCLARHLSPAIKIATSLASIVTRAASPRRRAF
jgi:hypothetical protein